MASEVTTKQAAAYWYEAAAFSVSVALGPGSSQEDSFWVVIVLIPFGLVLLVAAVLLSAILRRFGIVLPSIRRRRTPTPPTSS